MKHKNLIEAFYRDLTRGKKVKSVTKGQKVKSGDVILPPVSDKLGFFKGANDSGPQAQYTNTGTKHPKKSVVFQKRLPLGHVRREEFGNDIKGILNRASERVASRTGDESAVIRTPRWETTTTMSGKKKAANIINRYKVPLTTDPHYYSHPHYYQTPANFRGHGEPRLPGDPEVQPSYHTIQTKWQKPGDMVPAGIAPAYYSRRPDLHRKAMSSLADHALLNIASGDFDAMPHFVEEDHHVRNTGWSPKHSAFQTVDNGGAFRGTDYPHEKISPEQLHGLLNNDPRHVNQLDVSDYNIAAHRSTIKHIREYEAQNGGDLFEESAHRIHAALHALGSKQQRASDVIEKKFRNSSMPDWKERHDTWKHNIKTILEHHGIYNHIWQGEESNAGSMAKAYRTTVTHPLTPDRAERRIKGVTKAVRNAFLRRKKTNRLPMMGVRN